MTDRYDEMAAEAWIAALVEKRVPVSIARETLFHAGVGDRDTWVRAYARALRETVSGLEEALRHIGYHPHCKSEDPADDYANGAAEGHLCAAEIARKALAALDKGGDREAD